MRIKQKIMDWIDYQRIKSKCTYTKRDKLRVLYHKLKYIKRRKECLELHEPLEAVKKQENEVSLRAYDYLHIFCVV